MNKFIATIALVAVIAFGTFKSTTYAGTDPLPGFQSRPYAIAGTPSNGTDCVQTITFGGTPTGGTFTLTYKGFTTTAITWTATDATLVSNIDAALEALPTLAGGSSVTTAAGTVSSGIGTVTVTFAGNYAKLLVPAITVTSSLTGTLPTLACAITTPGVTADGRSAPKGALCVDTTNGLLYQNKGVSGLAPSWVNIATGIIPTVNVAAVGAVTQDALTDSTTGSPTTTLAAIADLSTSNTYSDAALNAKLAIIRNYVASLAAELAKVKTDNTAIRTSFNALLTSLVNGGVVTAP